MKKNLMLVLAMVISLGAFAQYNQGRMLVGGSAELSTSTNKTKDGNQTQANSTRTAFNLSPRFGYFIMDNLAVGAGLSMEFTRWNNKNVDGVDYNTNSISFRPFARYYLPVNVFFHGEFGFGTMRTKYESSFEDSKYNTFVFAAGAGYAWFLTDNVALEPMLQYRFTRGKESDSDYKNINSGIFLSVGFQIYLGNK